MGRGRNVVPLGRAGFRVFGVDIRLDAVRDAVATGAAAGVQVRGWCADLTACGLPCQSFELIVIARYLQRNLVHALRDAVVPGGAVIYETFTVAQRELGRGPTSADHLLLPGELAAQFEGFEVLLSEEVEGPEAVARFVGLKP
jgi:tellurite methyltransferase